MKQGVLKYRGETAALVSSVRNKLLHYNEIHFCQIQNRKDHRFTPK